MTTRDSSSKYLAKADGKTDIARLRHLAQVLSQQGRYEEAFADIERAMALAPNDPDQPYRPWRASSTRSGRAAEAEAQVSAGHAAGPAVRPGDVAHARDFPVQSGEIRGSRRRRSSGSRAQQAVTFRSTTSTLDRGARAPRASGRGVPAAHRQAYDAIAVPAAYDPFTVARKRHGSGTAIAFSTSTGPTCSGSSGRICARPALPEGAAAPTSPLDAYKPLITRSLGEFDVERGDQGRRLSGQGLPRAWRPIRRRQSPCRLRQWTHPRRRQSVARRRPVERDLGKSRPNKDDEVVFYCHGKYCPYSAYGAAKAIAWGHRSVSYFAGGFPAWQDAGLPVERSTSGR